MYNLHFKLYQIFITCINLWKIVKQIIFEQTLTAILLEYSLLYLDPTNLCCILSMIISQSKISDDFQFERTIGPFLYCNVYLQTAMTK